MLVEDIEQRMWYNEHDGYYQVEYGASYWAYCKLVCVWWALKEEGV
jgi:hypothetical protein